MASGVILADNGSSPLPFSTECNNFNNNSVNGKSIQQQKKTMFVKACCARCNQCITNWTVKTTREEEYSGDEGRCQDDSSLLNKYLNHYEQTDLYPSYLSCTYLGPEHVMTFPSLKAANLFLSRARELDMGQVRWHIPLLPTEPMKPNNNECSLLRAGGMSGLTSSIFSSDGSKLNDDVRNKMEFFPAIANNKGSRKKKNNVKPQAETNNHMKIKCGLICPKCHYLLASSPTSNHLGLNGRVVIYKSSLKLIASFKPFEGLSEVDESLSKEECQGQPPFVSHHGKILLIYSREQFEDILLRSAISNSRKIRKKSLSICNGEVKVKDPQEQQNLENDLMEAEGTCECNDACSYPKSSDLEKPEDLIIVMGGQFWNPFCISGVRRLSEYKQRQVKGLSPASKVTEDETSQNSEAGTTAERPSASSFPSSNAPTTQTPTTINNTSAGLSYIPSNVNLGQKKHIATVPMNINNKSSTTTFVSKISSSTSPCTFLLLDCLDGAGGFSPDDVLPEDTAKIVKNIPKFPFFLVWYRGCFVHVKGIGQHFQCIQGAIIGLDLARYIDIVVPRIALACEVAFAKTVLGVTASINIPTNLPSSEASRSKSDSDSFQNRPRSDSYAPNQQPPSKSVGISARKVIQDDISSVWKTKDAVPPIKDRPILKIKL